MTISRGEDIFRIGPGRFSSFFNLTEPTETQP